MAKFSNYKPRNTVLVTNLLNNRKLTHRKKSRIEPVPQNESHLQVIYTTDHWRCIYFDKKQIFVYNSIHREYLKKHEQLMIEALFPYFKELPLVYPIVQQQPNFKDCAVYAIAFATTIFFHGDPQNIVYDYSSNNMRKHLLRMLEMDSLTPFPVIASTPNIQNMVSNRLKQEICNEEWILRSLPNPDGVSCYANAVVQSTFHCLILRQSLIDSVETSGLKTLFNQYISNDNINIRALRWFAGHDFARREQQCPVEFFEALCEKSAALENVVRIDQSMITKCPRSECNYKRPVSPLDRRIFNLIFPLNPIEITYESLMYPTRIVEYTLQDLINYILSPIGNQQFCDNCGTELTNKFLININENVLIFQLEIFFNVSVNYEMIRIKYNGFSLKDPINDTLLIGGKKFKVSSIILHEGGDGTINSGHCVNLLRYNDSWVRTSDSQIKKMYSWSTNRGQPYLFFLEKVIESTIPKNKSAENAVFNHDCTSLTPDVAYKRSFDQYLSFPLSNGSKKSRINTSAEYADFNLDYTSPSLDVANKRKHDQYLLTPLSNASKKFRINENKYKSLKIRTNKIISYKNMVPSESSQVYLSTPSSVESGEKIIFYSQFNQQRRKTLRNKEYYQKNRLNILNNMKDKYRI